MRSFAAAAALALLLPVAAIAAEERATTKDAEMMVRRAADFLKKNGREKALAVFSDPKGPFTYRDLYIVVLDPNAVVVAHGTKKELIGKDFSKVKDPDGKLFSREMVEIAKTKGSGWTDYKFQNPATGAVEHKIAYVTLVGDLTVLCGAYRP